jgi:4-amino-4-deoxy-L-arabinose transferase-like glycosyltransferase
MDQPPNTPAIPLGRFAPSDRFDGGRLLPLVSLLILLTAVRLVGLKFSTVDMFYDESQYWSWAQNPSFGYFSKPPLLAWLLTGVHYACGDDEWCTRSPAPIIYAAISLLIYFIGRQLYGERAGFWAGVLTAFTPGIIFSARVISTDVPMLFFWAVALFSYLKIMELAQKRWAIVLGLSIGLGLLSKYAMIYFIPGMILASLVDSRARATLTNPATWLAFLIAAIVVSPNIIWNVLNAFATFKHTGSLVLGEPFEPSATRVLKFLASQLGVMGPVVFSVMMLMTGRFSSNELIEQDRLMVAFFITPILVVSSFAIYSKAYANWASPSIVPSLVASAGILLRLDRRYWLWGSIVFGVVFQSIILVTDTIATRFPSGILDFTNPYDRTLGWREYAEHAGQLAVSLGAKTIATDNRRTFNTLRYYWRDRPQVVASWELVDVPSYDQAHPLTQQSPEPIVFVSSCPNVDRLQEFYSIVEPLGIFPDLKNDHTRRFFAFKLSQNRAEIQPLRGCPP